MICVHFVKYVVNFNGIQINKTVKTVSILVLKMTFVHIITVYEVKLMKFN